MSTGLVIVAVLAVLVAGLAIGYWLPPHGRRPAAGTAAGVRRILLPFTGQAISRRAFETSVRLAQAENATLMPAFLARVPRTLPIDAPLPAQSAGAMSLMEAIEQLASARGIAVDGRVARGRTYRHALSRLLEGEQFERVIVSATDSPRVGLSSEDLKWLLTRVPAEVLVLRPAYDDTRRIEAEALRGHF